MANFKDWLDDFAVKNELNPNNTFTFTRKDGNKEVVTLKQIFDFVATQSEKVQEQFKDSLLKGQEANNIAGYMYQASRRFKLPAMKESEINVYESEQHKKDDWKENWRKEQDSIKENAINLFQDLEDRLKNPETAKEALKEYQEYVAQFKDLYRYSINNVMLIQSQMEQRGIEPSGFVKSEKDWKDLGVSVKDKPIKIFVPHIEKAYEMKAVTEKGVINYVYKLDENGEKIPKLDKDGNQITHTSYWLTGKVYDANQTDAYESGIIKKMDGVELANERYTKDKLIEIAKVFSDKLKVDINFRPIQQDMSGYFTTKNGKSEIHVDSNMDINNQLATLLHEVGHRILHTQDYFDRKVFNKTRRECEAESFAFITSNQFKLETSSAKYLLGYLQADPNNKLKDVFADVLKAVRTFNDKVDVEELMNKIHKENTQDTMKTDEDKKFKQIILNCQEAVWDRELADNKELLAVAFLRDFYTSYGKANDETMSGVVKELYQVDFTKEDVFKIQELTKREINMDLKVDFEDKPYSLEDIRAKYDFEMKDEQGLSEAQKAVLGSMYDNALSEFKKDMEETQKASEEFNQISLEDKPNLQQENQEENTTKNTQRQQRQ